MQKALLDQVPEELLLSNPGNVYSLLMMAQAKHREQSVGLIADGFREAAKKAIPIKVNEIAALVEAIRHFWDSRKSSEPNSPPPPVDPQELTAEVYALMEESYFDNHSLLVANIESDVLADRLRAIITSAVSRGATARELADDIEKGIGGPNYSGWRALRVARTEVNAMMNRINLDAMSRTGVVSSKIWLAMADNAVRDTHRAADGQEVPINQPFVVGGMPMMCPGDPAGGPKEVVNCRCSMLPVINPAYIPADVDYETLLSDISGSLGQ
jgi:SPP1 gp7 family putative phage head morphogenesis protein